MTSTCSICKTTVFVPAFLANITITSIPEPIAVYSRMRSYDWFNPTSHVPCLSRDETTLPEAESKGRKRDTPERAGDGNQDEVNRCWAAKTTDAHHPHSSHQETTEARTMFVFGLKIAATAVGGQWDCLGRLWAGASEFFIALGR